MGTRHHQSMLLNAASRGNDAACRWLVERLQPVRDHGFAFNVVLRAAHHGHPALAAWLGRQFPPQVTYKQRRHALKVVAAGGSVEVCQFIAAHLGDAEWRDVEAAWALVAAAQHGHLAVCTWLADRFHVDCAGEYIQKALQAAAKGGHTAVCAWLVDRFDMTAARAAGDIDRALEDAVLGGHLGVSQLLVARFGLTPQLPPHIPVPYRDVRMCEWLLAVAEPPLPIRSALCRAVQAGNVVACHLVASRCRFPDADAAEWVCRDAWNALWHFEPPWRHSAVCRWLVEHFRWTAQHRPRLPEGTFLGALRADLATCRWLVDHFQLAPHASWRTKVVALRHAAKMGDVEKCRWLVALWDLTVADVRFDNTAPFHDAAKKGHLPVCRWLVDTFGLTADDVGAGQYAQPHHDVSRWMALRFPRQ